MAFDINGVGIQTSEPLRGRHNKRKQGDESKRNVSRA